MKKIFFALIALSAVALGFSSCDSKADPATQPIAGKSYQYNDTEVGGYFKVTFHMNYKCTQEVKKDKDSSPIVNSLFTWDMSGNYIDVRYARNAEVNGVPVGGLLIYNGVYDAANKTVTLTMKDDPKVVFVMKELQ